MTNDKLKRIKSFILNYLIIMLIAFSTFLFYLFNPNYKYVNEKYFNTKYSEIATADQFCLLPDNPYFDIVTIIEEEKSIILKYRNLKTQQIKESDIINISGESLIVDEYTQCYSDNVEESVHTIVTKNNADYFLYELYNKNKKNESELIKIFRYELFDSLKDTVLIMKNIKFHKPDIIKESEDICNIVKFKDGCKILLSEDIYKSIYYDSFKEDIENPDSYNAISKKVYQLYKIELSNYEIYEIVHFFLRNSYYQKKYFSNNSGNGFLFSRIVERIDVENDGEREFLIAFQGDRWINDLLICYSSQKQKIIWKREFSHYLGDFSISDIDNDGENEIIFRTSTPCCEQSIDRFKNKSIGSKNIGYFRILDSSGNDKIIKSRPVIVKTDPGYNKFKYLYLKKQKKILLGVISNYDNSAKNLLLLDLKNNSLSELEIGFQNLIELYKDNNKIVAITLYNNVITKTILSRDFKVLKTISKPVSRNFQYLHNFCKIDGKYYNGLLPGKLVDDNLNLISDIDENIRDDKGVWDNNTFYFIDNKNDKNILFKIEFSRNKTLNPIFILLIIFELILILLYYYFRQLLFLPFVSGESSYAVLYRIFGSLYFWRIYGKLSFYRFPRNLSRTNNRFFYLLKDLTTDYKEIYNKRSFVIQIRLFQLNTQNELFLVQRIAHDIKNQLHLINLQLSDYEEDEKESNKSEKIIEKIKPTMKEIYKKTILMSGF